LQDTFYTGTDRDHWPSMSKLAQQAMGVEKLATIADREIRFGKADSIYDGTATSTAARLANV